MPVTQSHVIIKWIESMPTSQHTTGLLAKDVNICLLHHSYFSSSGTRRLPKTPAKWKTIATAAAGGPQKAALDTLTSLNGCKASMYA